MNKDFLAFIWIASCLFCGFGGFLSGYSVKQDRKPSEVYHTNERAVTIVLTNTDTRVIYKGQVFHFNESYHKENKVIKKEIVKNEKRD